MKSAFITLLFVGLSASAWADVVLLKNGDRLTGQVDSISSGQVLLVTDYAGTVPIKADAIAELSTQEAFVVSTEAGKTEGKFAVVDGSQSLMSEQGHRELALEKVQSAGQNKLSMTTLTRDWSSRADLAASFSNGNSDSENYSALIESTLKKEVVEHSVRLMIANEKAEDVQTKEELDLDYGYKRFISEHWFASGNFEYFEDPLKDVDSRITVGAGAGYQFWDNSFGAFSTDLGVSYVREDLDDETETNPAVRWGLDYKKYLMAKKMELFHKQSVLFIPDDDRGEVIQSSSGVRYALNSKIDAMFRVDVDHETDPSPGNSKTDVTYNLGIGIKF